MARHHSKATATSVIGAVNGPIEVQRRDELPDEAAVDVVVRPAAGVGGISLSSPEIKKLVTDRPTCIRERHLESVIQSTLRHIIFVSAHPRTLIQVTLQVVDGQGDDSVSSGLPQSASVGIPPDQITTETNMTAEFANPARPSSDRHTCSSHHFNSPVHDFHIYNDRR